MLGSGKQFFFQVLCGQISGACQFLTIVTSARLAANESGCFPRRLCASAEAWRRLSRTENE